MNESNNEDDNKDIRLIISILVSSILGGLMSLYIFRLYQENVDLSTNLELKTFFAIGFQAIAYLFYIGLALLVAWILYKLVTFVIYLIVQPIDSYLGLFGIKRNQWKDDSEGLDVVELYKSNSDFINFTFILLFFWWLVFQKREYLFNILNVKQILIGTAFIMFYILFFLFRSLRKNRRGLNLLAKNIGGEKSR